MGKWFSYLSWLQIVLIMVALMSGILSIIRELISIYAPNRVVGGSLFWRCVWVSFIISAVLLWGIEHGHTIELQERLDSLTKPIIEYRFEQWAFISFKDSPESTRVFAQIALKNRGAASIVEHWEMSMTYPDGTILSGTREAFPHIPVFELDANLKLYPEDSLFTKDTDAPIVTGGKRSGWVLFRFPRPRKDFVVPGSFMTLSVDDIEGTSYHVKQNVRGDNDKKGPLYYPGFRLDRPDNPEPRK
jgi:hypothetical protein